MNSGIKINGVTIAGNASNLVINNGRVFVGGKDVTPDSKNISIEILGSIDRLEADACNSIKVAGDANTIKTMSGDVEVGGNVAGSVSSMSGDIDCGSIGGSVSTMSGDIRHK